MMKFVGASVLFAVAAEAGSLPLDAINFEGGPRLTILANPLNTSGAAAAAPQRLLLDTGSSTLAFCDTEITKTLKALESQYYSCNIYGNAQVQEGYWGPFFKGGVSVGDGSIKIPDAYYSVMQQQVSMPCGSEVSGIFGIAFHQLDQATSVTPGSWPTGSVGSCPRPSTDFVQPLMQFLNNQGGVKQLGIYWSGSQGQGQGQLYLDDDATSNPHHDAVRAGVVGKARLGEFGWYDINVESVDYNGKSYTDITCDPQRGSPCIMDTGTPVIVIPQDAYDALASTKSGELSVKLTPSDPSANAVVLKFDAKTLLDNQWVEPSPQAGVILGLPFRAFYYAVMDISDQSVSFTPVQAFVAGRDSEIAGLVRNVTLIV